ncbi:MAG: hypothetical protein OHK0035_24050 [Cyanobacteria bacterium J069]
MLFVELRLRVRAAALSAFVSVSKRLEPVEVVVRSGIASCGCKNFSGSVSFSNGTRFAANVIYLAGLSDGGAGCNVGAIALARD